MTFVFFISIILPDVSLSINTEEYIPNSHFAINQCKLTSLFAWTVFGVLGKTLPWVPETFLARFPVSVRSL